MTDLEPDAWRLFVGKNDKYLNITVETDSEIVTGRSSEMASDVKKEWEALFSEQTIKQLIEGKRDRWLDLVDSEWEEAAIEGLTEDLLKEFEEGDASE